MIEARFKPLGAWPRKETTDRKRAPFKSAYTSTLNLLEKELDSLGADQIEIQLDLDRSKIRNDGWPKQDARPRSPKVIVSFVATRQAGRPTRVFPCDAFSYWEDNLRAIALSLHDLRRIDRYGVALAGEQYAGFKQLPSMTAPTMTTEVAAREVSQYSVGRGAHEVLTDVNAARDVIRLAIHHTHPDRNANERERYDRVEIARRVLSSHHGVSL